MNTFLKKILIYPLFVGFFVLLSSCTSCEEEKEKSLLLYTSRHYPVDEKVYELFKKKTGITIQEISNSSFALIEKISVEKEKSTADLLITTDVSSLGIAKEKGLLAPVTSKILAKKVPLHLRDSEGFWHAFTRRTRVIAYNPKKVSLEKEQLVSYESLAEPKWKGRLLVTSSASDYNRSLLASLVATLGEEKAKMWAKGIVANMAQEPSGHDKEQIKAIFAGIGDVAIVNHYYVQQLLHSKTPEEREVGAFVKVLFPNQKGRGSHANISGAAVTAFSKKQKMATSFIEFLLTEEVQALLQKENFEYSVFEKQSPGIKLDALPLSKILESKKSAMSIFREVKWK